MNIDTKDIFIINDGELYIEGVRATELAERFGTPLFVYSETLIRSHIEEIKRDFLDKSPGSFAAYAGKAFLTPAMCRLIDEEGLHLDVASGGEFFTAMRAGFPPERITFHGNNKIYEELDDAVKNGLGRVVIDGIDELETVIGIAAEHGRVQSALLRITPEVSAGAHAHISTGKRDSKFGIPMDDHILYPLIQKAIESPHIQFRGLHFHIGSQIFDAEPFVEATGHALKIIEEVYRRFAYTIPELIIGGGFGIHYTGDEERKPYLFYLDPVMRILEDFCGGRGMAPPAIGVEPGRSSVGDAGVTLYKVGTIKRIPDSLTFVSVDGGMSDNIRPALYGAKYEAVIANKAGELPTEKVTVCGRLCESGDRIIEDVYIASPERGDVLCVFSTGAYGYSMASNYNKIPKPAVVLVKGGEARLIVRRQTFESMTVGEI
jgi:diaminopimelate decarboxylase